MPRSFPQYSMEFLILYFVLWSTTSATNLPNNTFINPQPATDVSNHSASVSWPLNSNQTIQWNSNMTTYELWLYQVNDLDQNGTGSLIYNQSDDTSGQRVAKFSWQVTTALNFYQSPTFWLELHNGDDYLLNGKMESQYFNITLPASSTSSSSTASPTASVSSTPSSTAPPTASVSSTPSSISSAQLSTGAKVGIGITIPVLAFAALIAGFFFWRRHRVSKDMVDAMQDQTGNYPEPVYSDHGKAELPAEEVRRKEPVVHYELPTGERDHVMAANEELGHELRSREVPGELPRNELI